MSNICTYFNWTPGTVSSLGPTTAVCVIASIIHGMFWIQTLVYPSSRKRSMILLYIYIFSDGILLVRFFVLYGIHRSNVCVLPALRTFICGFESSSKIYIDITQNYLLLIFNIFRYIQIVCNRNIYIEKLWLIILILCFIYTMPVIIYTVQFRIGGAYIHGGDGESCDILYRSLAVQIFNIVIIYAMPLFINIILICLGIRHGSSTQGVTSEQIISIRLRRQRRLLLQTLTFYSVWLILWSPDALANQFVNLNSDPAAFTSLLSYIATALDPLIIAIIDVRFMVSWRIIWKKLRRNQRRVGVFTFHE